MYDPEVAFRVLSFKATLDQFARTLSGKSALATAPRQKLMVDALINVATEELQGNFNLSEVSRFLYRVQGVIREDRKTTHARVLAVEQEYTRLGGDGLEPTHRILFFTSMGLYEHISGKELPTNERMKDALDQLYGLDK